jgi:hypothetical protein
MNTAEAEGAESDFDLIPMQTRMNYPGAWTENLELILPSESMISCEFEKSSTCFAAV